MNRNNNETPLTKVFEEQAKQDSDTPEAPKSNKKFTLLELILFCLFTYAATAFLCGQLWVYGGKQVDFDAIIKPSTLTTIGLYAMAVSAWAMRIKRKK